MFESRQGTFDYDLKTLKNKIVIKGPPKNWARTILVHFLVSSKQSMTICSIKKRKTFFTQTLFSEWIKEMDHHECGWRGGSTSDECEKGFLIIEHEVLFF
jgi:1,2-phenylacetyl-CoA epoxidase catalytic subunit